MSIAVARILPDGIALFRDSCVLTAGPAPDPDSKERIEFLTPRIALCRMGITHPEIPERAALPLELERATVEQIVEQVDEALAKSWYDFVANTVAKWPEDKIRSLVIKGPFNAAVLLLAGIADRPFAVMISRALALAPTGKVRLLGVDWPKNRVHIAEFSPLLKVQRGDDLIISARPGSETAKYILKSEMRGCAWTDAGPLNPYLKKWIHVGEGIVHALERVNPEMFGGTAHWAVIREGFPVQQGGTKWPD